MFKIFHLSVEIRILLLTFIVALILVILLRDCSGPHADPEVRGTADSILYWKNKYGEAVASQKAQAEAFSLQDQRIHRLLDSIARVYDTKASRIQELIVASLKGKVSIPAVPGTQER